MRILPTASTVATQPLSISVVESISQTIAGPVIVGIVPGAMFGSWFVVRLRVRVLRLVFLSLVGLVGLQMLYRAVESGT